MITLILGYLVVSFAAAFLAGQFIAAGRGE